MIWGTISNSYAHVNWSSMTLISGADLSFREGSNQHDLTEKGTTGIYNLPSDMVGGRLYTLYDNGTDTAIQFQNEDQQWYYQDPSTLPEAF